MQLRRFLPICALVYLITGCGGSTTAPTVSPSQPSAPFQHMYVADTANHIYAFNYPLSASSTPAVTLSASAAGLATFGNQLYAIDGNVVNVYTLPLSSTSTPARTITLNHNGFDVTLDSTGRLYAAENFSGTCCVDVVDPGAATPSFTLSGANVAYPWGVTTDAAGDLFVANANPVGYFSAPVTSASTGMSFGRDLFNEGIAVDSHSNLYVADGDGAGTLDIYNSPFTVASAPASTSTFAGYDLMQMAMASNDVLYVAVQSGGNQVDVMQPPYTSVSFAVAIPTAPYGIALGK